MFKKILIVYSFVLLKTFSVFSQDKPFPLSLDEILESYHESNPGANHDVVRRFLEELENYLRKRQSPAYFNTIPSNLSEDSKKIRSEINGAFFTHFKGGRQSSEKLNAWPVINFVSDLRGDENDKSYQLVETIYKKLHCKRSKLPENLIQEIDSFLTFSRSSECTPESAYDRLERISYVTEAFLNTLVYIARDNFWIGGDPKLSSLFDEGSKYCKFEEAFKCSRVRHPGDKKSFLEQLSAVLTYDEVDVFNLIQQLYTILPNDPRRKEFLGASKIPEIIIKELRYVLDQKPGEKTRKVGIPKNCKTFLW
jgi:hypothetical protein